MSAIRAVIQRTALMGLCAAGATTCASLTEPIQYPAVMLQELRVYSYSVLRDSGVLIITGVPQDTTRVQPPNARLRLELATSAGDVEPFDLSPIVCDEFTLACHIVDVVMKDGRHVGELFSLLNSVPARVYLVAFAGELGSVYVFHPERVPDAVRQLGSHPAVESAERSAFAAFPPPRKWPLQGGLPLDVRPVGPRDGVLQGQPGDTLTVRYAQPDSSVLELRFTIPVP